MLVFGAGTDYALLLVARYREELRRHHDRHEAMAVALHRSGPAIFASAGTVIVGMLCLMVAETNSTQGLGPVLAIGVAVALLAMVTLLPALLVICGRWVFWPQRPVEGSAEPTASGFWARVGQRISVHPRGVWTVTAGVLAVAALGIFALNATGLQTKDQFTKTVDSVVGEQVIEDHGFPGGAGTPVVVMSNADQADQVASAVEADPGIAAVDKPVVSNGEAYISATLNSAPDSDAAYNTVDRLRTTVHGIDGAEALVGGGTAVNLDVQRAADHDRNVIIPLVLVVVFLILMLLLRAIVAPLILIGTVVLSFGAALGISALLFKYVFDFNGADNSLPLFVFVFLVALGIDYNIFLMTRVREEAQRYGTRRGALIGLAATGGVITSAGLVLAGTFVALGMIPMVAFAEIGIAVALGVLLGHDRRTLRARHGAEPRHRPAHVVAERPRAQGGRRHRRAPRARAGLWSAESGQLTWSARTGNCGRSDPSSQPRQPISRTGVRRPVSSAGADRLRPPPAAPTRSRLCAARACCRRVAGSCSRSRSAAARTRSGGRPRTRSRWPPSGPTGRRRRQDGRSASARASHGSAGRASPRSPAGSRVPPGARSASATDTLAAYWPNDSRRFATGSAADPHAVGQGSRGVDAAVR